MAAKPWNNPFGELKALKKAAEAEAEAARKKAREPPPPPSPVEPPPERPRSEAELWAEATLGARPVERGTERVSRAAPSLPPDKYWHPDLEAVDALRALVSGDAPFDLSDTDEYVEGCVAGLDQAVVKKLRRGEFAVQGHVDLHGLTRGEAKAAVDDFLRKARGAGKRCVLVVHGRGLHSKDQLPVLKDALRSWLASARFARHVLAFATARPADGGAGAVYVLLRRPGR
ncbi:MAG: Smr/MutS family protein [Anaeromyxobacteraceae bacterium]